MVSSTIQPTNRAYALGFATRYARMSSLGSMTYLSGSIPMVICIDSEARRLSCALYV